MTRTMRRRHFAAADGWLLIETVLLLSLLSIFMLLASQLFVSVARIHRDVGHSRTLATRFDTMLWQLRRDVWRATRIDGDGTTLLLTQPDDHRITWRFGDTVERQSADAVRHWTQLPPSMAITTGPGRVMLEAGGDPAGGRVTRFTLVSQLMLAEGAR